MEDKNDKKSQAAVVSTVAAASTIVKSAPAANLAKNQAELSKLQNDQNSNVKKLVDSLKTVTDTLKAGFKTKDSKSGADSISKAIGNSIKDILTGKGAGLKDLMTKEGLLGGLASMAGGGLTSTILGGAAEKIKAGKEEEQARKEWKKTFLQETEQGKQLQEKLGTKGAEQQADKLYEQKLNLEKEIADLEEKQKRVEAAGLGEKTQQTAIGAKQQQLTDLTKPLEESNEIESKQLEELKKLVLAATPTEEDRLESKKKIQQEITAPAAEKAKKEEGKGLLDSLMDLKNLKGTLGGLVTKAGPLLSMASKALPFAGSAAAVAGAGYLGYKGGEWLNETALNPLAEAITGDKGDTVGTALYSGVDKFKGMMGFETDADRQRMAEQQGLEQARAALAKRKAAQGAEKIQLPADDAAQSQAALSKAMSEYNTASPAEKMQIKDTIGAASISESDLLESAMGKVLRGATLSAEETAVLEKNKIGTNTLVGLQPTAPVPTALPITRSEQQTQMMQQRTADVVDKKTEQKPIIIQTPAPAPTPAVMTQTNTTIVRPDTRSKEPTFNRVLSNNFTFA